MIPFWVASVTGLIFSVLASTEARRIGISHHLNHVHRTVLVLGANVGAFAVLWILKFLFFNRLFHITPEAELERGLEV